MAAASPHPTATASSAAVAATVTAAAATVAIVTAITQPSIPAYHAGSSTSPGLNGPTAAGPAWISAAVCQGSAKKLFPKIRLACVWQVLGVLAPRAEAVPEGTLDRLSANESN